MLAVGWGAGVTLRIGSLCSGYGGLDMAAEWVCQAGTVWHAENAAAPSRILAARWPGVPNHGDLTRIDWHQVEPIDLLTAGYPCPPFSVAGQRKGAADVRHLWPHVHEAIRLLRPRFAILENVAGHFSLGFDRVLGDLAEIGYDASWTCVRASDVGAPHARARLFAIAYPADAEAVGRPIGIAEPARPEHGSVAPDRDPTPADADSGTGGWRSDIQIRSTEGREATTGHRGGSPAATYTRGEERPRWSGLREDESAGFWGPRLGDGDDDSDFDWRQYRAAIDRWSVIVGRRPPRPVVKGRNAGRSLSARFVEWMMGLPVGWVTDVQGVNRKAALEALGNGVVPQQAEAALRQMLTACEVAA